MGLLRHADLGARREGGPSEPREPRTRSRPHRPPGERGLTSGDTPGDLQGRGPWAAMRPKAAGTRDGQAAARQAGGQRGLSPLGTSTGKMQTLKGKWGPQEEALMGLLVDLQGPLRDEGRQETGGRTWVEGRSWHGGKRDCGQSPRETPSAHAQKGPLDITAGQERPDQSGQTGSQEAPTRGRGQRADRELEVAGQ